MNKTIANKLTEGRVLPQLMKFALPVILANCLQTLYNLVDMIVVGYYVGTDGLSAVSVAGQVTQLLLNFGMGFAVGGQMVIAQLVGADDNDGLRGMVGTLCSVIAGLGIVATIVGVLFHAPILNAMNTPTEAMGQAKSYLVICSFGTIFIYGYNCVCAILRGMGDSKRPLVFVAIATVVNIVFDILFVGVFKMTAAGAALATVISQAIAFLGAVGYLYICRDSFIPNFKAKNFIIRKSELLPIIRTGLPLALMESVITFSMMFVSSFVNAFGNVATAVTGIGTKMNYLMQIIAGAMNSAGGSMIGQNVGAGKPGRIKQVVWCAMGFCLTGFFIVTALSLLCPVQLFSIFSKESAVLDMAPTYMRIAIVMYLTFALMSPFLGLLYGIGFSSLNFLVAILDGVIARIALSLLLGNLIGLEGFWFGNALAGFVSVIIPGAYFFSGKWKDRRLLIK